MDGPLLRRPVLQHAHVVADLDAAMARWTRTTGAGPWWVSRSHYGHRHTYRGEPWDEPLHYAFAGTGPTHVQLIEQPSSTSSIYRDMYAPGEEGFHHVAMLVPEAEHAAEVARFVDAGFPVASTLWSTSTWRTSTAGRRSAASWSCTARTTPSSNCSSSSAAPTRRGTA